ncbi:MAG: hypothetical protein IJO94_08605 [Firmicutes bacterium]|nr:hypothetical protein [Bacillota bacterium]
MKKFLVSAVSFIIGTALAVTGALAYVNADIQLLNGNSATVKAGDIVQMSCRRAENGEQSIYTWNQVDLTEITEQTEQTKLVPAAVVESNAALSSISDAPGVQDKFVVAKNISETPVYIRTYIAFEAGDMTVAEFSNTIGYRINNSSNYYSWKLEPQKVVYAGKNYYAISATSVDPLTGGAISEPSLLQFYIKQNTTEAFSEQFGKNYRVLVVTDSNTESVFADDYAAVFSSISQ